jgi:hypothetical protein
VPSEASAIETAREALGLEKPKSWIWQEDGEELAGRYVSDDEASTRDGDRVPIHVIKVGDDFRSLWMFESPKLLREKWDEAAPSIGDYVIVRRYPKRKTADGERFYWPFAVAKVRGESPSDGSGASSETPSDGLGGSRVDNAGVHEPF